MGGVKSRCVHESPAVSSCARTYSGQRPGRISGSANRLSPVAPIIRGEHRRPCQPSGKIIGGTRSGPRIAHRIRQRARRLPAGTGSRGGLAKVAAAQGSAAAIRLGRPAARPLSAAPGSRSEWTFDGPAVDLRWTRHVPGRPGAVLARGQISASPGHSASDRRCREPGRRRVIGRRSRQRGADPGSERTGSPTDRRRAGG